MTPIYSLINSSIRDFSPPTEVFNSTSTSFSTLFTLFHKVHRVWRWQFRLRTIYLNCDNFQKLAAGHVVHWTVGDHTLVRVAAQSILIARKLLDCYHQRVRLSASYKQWIDTLKGKSYIHIEVQNRSSPSKILSPSSSYRLQRSFRYLIERVKRIAWESFNLLKETFLMSMRLMEVVEAFSLTPEKGRESVNELFIHSSQLLTELIDSKESLLTLLRGHKPLIDKILCSVRSKYTVIDLSEHLSTLIDGVEKVAKVQKKVPETIAEMLKDGASTVAIAVTGYSPNFLLPRGE